MLGAESGTYNNTTEHHQITKITVHNVSTNGVA